MYKSISVALLSLSLAACSTHEKDSTKTKAEGAAIGETIGGLFGAPGAIAGALIGHQSGEKVVAAKTNQAGQESRLEKETAATKADSKRLQGSVAAARSATNKPTTGNTAKPEAQKTSGGVRRIFGL